MPTQPDNALTLFRQRGGMLSTTEALQLKIAPRTLYALRDAGTVVELSRGLYRLADLPPLTQPDLVIVARRIPRGVICLISALALYELTTQIPHAVYVALPQHAEKPRLTYPPVRLFWYAPAGYAAGVTTQTVDGVTLKVYSREKTIADCFKFRNKLGLAVALEALKRYREQSAFRLQSLLYFARLNHVEKLMRPYLEMLA